MLVSVVVQISAHYVARVIDAAREADMRAQYSGYVQGDVLVFVHEEGMASILAARKLSQFDSSARVPVTINAIADAVRWAERIMPNISVSPDGAKLLYTGSQSSESDLVLVDGFR